MFIEGSQNVRQTVVGKIHSFFGGAFSSGKEALFSGEGGKGVGESTMRCRSQSLTRCF